MSWKCEDRNQLLEMKHMKQWTFHVEILLHSFIQAISKLPLQVHYYSEALPIQHGYCVVISR